MSKANPAAQTTLGRIAALIGDHRLTPYARAAGTYILCRLKGGPVELSVEEIKDAFTQAIATPEVVAP
jgi:hypothetical protein